MAKRSRQRDPLNEASRTETSRPSTRTTRRPRAARASRRQSLLERYSGLLVVGLGVAGMLIIVLFLFQGGARGAYECESFLTPGPEETVSPRPVSPSPITSPSPSPAESPSPDASPDASPGTSPDASPDASPGATPEATPSPEPSPTASPSPLPDPTPRLGFTTTNLGAEHVRDPGETISYGFCPPSSGPHWNAPNLGPIRGQFYPPSQEQAPGGWVHNLEHGYVVALYRCTDDGDCPSEAELEQLRRFVAEAPGSSFNPACTNKVLAARFDGMESRFALLAWGRALLMDEFDLDTAITFAEQWIDHAAVPERGLC